MSHIERLESEAIHILREAVAREFGLLLAFRDAFARDHGFDLIETDMRAKRNPKRMRASKRATIDLVRRVTQRESPEIMK